MRFCANLSLLFTELPLAKRFAAAADCGFEGVEIQFPYPLQPDALAELLNQNSQQLVLFNLPAGDWDSGERGIACHPDRVDEFKRGVELARRYARATGCLRINCLAGIPPAAVTTADAEQTLIANLAYAADNLAADGLQLCVEPINSRDIPGFLLNRSDQTAALLERVGRANLRLQYDIYHMQIMEGNLSNRLAELLPIIGHIQLADAPGRHQPGTGEINFPNLLNHLDRLGYTGWIGLEYLPLQASAASFGWMETLPEQLRNRR
ncbi:hydroxypyruvate isomerase [Motiliproteus sediminis]|uniref:hydroxypyruvate isomerase n=1 Tax=Motiliproteus sediminis TaxID=1468178 RepID=UPI001FE3D318|nr:hydroxypyruvate isomerase [Motiliproteus sediminis]